MKSLVFTNQKWKQKRTGRYGSGSSNGYTYMKVYPFSYSFSFNFSRVLALAFGMKTRLRRCRLKTLCHMHVSLFISSSLSFPVFNSLIRRKNSDSIVFFPLSPSLFPFSHNKHPKGQGGVTAGGGITKNACYLWWLSCSPGIQLNNPVLYRLSVIHFSVLIPQNGK